MVLNQFESMIFTEEDLIGNDRWQVLEDEPYYSLRSNYFLFKGFCAALDLTYPNDLTIYSAMWRLSGPLEGDTRTCLASAQNVMDFVNREHHDRRVANARGLCEDMNLPADDPNYTWEPPPLFPKVRTVIATTGRLEKKRIIERLPDRDGWLVYHPEAARWRIPR
jgi:hypothetical protein